MSETRLDEQRQVRESKRVDPGNSRSWQLVSALRADEFDPAQLGRADQIILDVEDAVDPSLKAKARSLVIDWLTGGGHAWVRINDVTTSHWEDDVAALAGVPGLHGVMLAKTENAESVTATAARLDGLAVLPLVESALGIEEATAIARAEGAFRLAFGSGDYRKDTGTENVPMAMAYPRSRLVLGSRIGGLPGPVDGPTPFSSHAVLRDQCSDAVALGMTGKLCLDLDQPAVINEAIAPTRSDVAWAIDFLDDFEKGGRVIRDGSDKPRLARAERIRERALVFGIEPAAF